MLRSALALLLTLAGPIQADESPYRYLPSDTKVVLTINVPSLGAPEQAGLHQLVQQLFRTHLAPEKAKEAKLPIQIDQVVLGLPYAGSFNGLFLLRGKLDRPALEKQMEVVAKETTALRIERMGSPAAAVYSRKLDEKPILTLLPPLARIPGPFRKLVIPQEAHLTILDEQTLLISLAGKKQLDRALRARPVTSRLRVTDELARALRKQDAKDQFRMILLDDSLHPGLALTASDEVRETFEQFETITMRASGARDVEVEIVVQGKSSDLGPILATKSKKALDAFGDLLPTIMADATKRGVMESLVKSFRITRKDERVTLTGRISESDARKLLAPPKP